MAGSTKEINKVDFEPGSSRRECVVSFENKIRELPEVSTPDRVPSIFRVNQQLRKQDPEAYEPKVVSFGPLHHGKANLIPMEDIKLEVLRNILRGRPGNTLDIFFDVVFECLEKAREEYHEKIDLTDDNFAQMLVTDGCFFIAVCSLGSPDVDLKIFGNTFQKILLMGYGPHLGTDLYLLENQLPFFVVNGLFKKFCVLFPEVEHVCMDFLLKTINIKIPPTKYPKEEDLRHFLHLIGLAHDPRLVPDEPSLRSYWDIVMIPVKKVMYLVSMAFFGLFYLILFRDFSGLFGAPKGSTKRKIIWTATELHEAGIKFQPKARYKEDYTARRLKIFFMDGKLEIPPLPFDRPVCILLRNLIAFEHGTYLLYSSHATHYGFLFDDLINTHEDVSILRQSGILENGLGSDSELAEMVNSLCRGVTRPSKEDPYAELREELQKFCQVPQNKWRANLARSYFQSPWTVLSVLAAITLLAFTITQTFFTIYPKK